MELALVTDTDISMHVAREIGVDFCSQDDLIAELLRSELAARRVSSRRGLCNRVAILVDSFSPADIGVIKDNLLTLEKVGDITSGPGGQVAATPIRAVKLADNKYQLFGTVNYNQIATIFPKSSLSTGLTRILDLKGSDRQNFGQILDELGGLELSPERWAGMDKINAANQKWIDGLNSLLIVKPRPAESLDNETLAEWRVYQPDKATLLQKARWHKNDKGVKGCLWRIWHERGWPIYAWTAGNSPDQEECIRLSNEDACRTMFALDREADAGISCQITTNKNVIHLKIGGFLPRAEYRYLAIRGKFTGKDGDYFCFQFKSATWAEVSNKLNERLGIPG